MIIIVLLLVFFPSVCSEGVNLDKFLVSLGNRSASFHRTQTVDVFEQRAHELNVTAQTFVDTCTDNVNELLKAVYPTGDVIREIFNITEVEEMADFVMRNGDRVQTFIEEKKEIILSKLDNVDLHTTILVERIFDKVQAVFFRMGKSKNISNEDIEKWTTDLKSKILALIDVIEPEVKLELERLLCARTLLDLLIADPVIGKVAKRFSSAKSVFLDEFIAATKARGNISLEYVTKIMQEEASRLGIPVQQHIERCTWVHYDAVWNFTIIDDSLVNFNKKNLNGRRLNSTTELYRSLMNESHQAWNEVVGSMNMIQTGFDNLSPSGKSFVERLSKNFINTLIYYVHNPIEKLTCLEILGTMKEKMMNDFKELSRQDKNDLEREYCTFTSLRIFDGSEKTRKMIEFFRTTNE